MGEGSRISLNKCVAGLAGILALVAVSDSASAAVVGKRASFVVDANTGRVLHAHKATQHRYPASLTKMMTLYIVFEHISDGRLTFATTITASRYAASRPPSRIGLKVGDRITVRQAVKALVTKSANDVATAVAEHIAGSEPAFARLMTRKARQLGMTQTTFRNASGLPDQAQVTTARDMAQLALRLSDHFPRHFRQFRTRKFTYKGRKYRNHNALLGRYRGVDGIKTGYTRASGFNLVTSLKRDGRHVVAVVLGGKTGRARNAKMRTLLAKHVPSASASRTRQRSVRVALRQAPRPNARTKAPRRPQATKRRSWQPSTARYAASRPPAARRETASSVNRTDPKITIARVRRVDVRAPAPQGSSASRSSRPAAHPRGPRRVEPGPALRRTDFRPPRTVREYTAQQPTTYTTASAPPSTARRVVRRPGTLEQQAARLQQTASPRLSPTPASYGGNRRPGTLGSGRSFGQFQIQVGAFFSVEEAHRQLAKVSSRAGSVLGGARPLALRISSGKRNLYRARYAGFDAKTASTTCLEMRRLNIDCFVARAN